MPYIKPIKRTGPYQREEEGQRPMRPGAGAPGMSGAPAASAPQQAAGGTSVPGSQHINLQDYLKANQGQGAQMADKVVGGIQQGAAKIGGAQETKMNSTLTSLPQGPVQPEWTEASSGAANDAYSRPNSMAANPLKRDPGYLTGQAEQDQANKVSEQANMLGTAGGQQQLLDKAYGSGRSQGESDFDNALMGAGSGGKLEGAKKQYGDLGAWVKDNQAATATRGRDAEVDALDAGTRREAFEAQGAAAASAGEAAINAEREKQRKAGMPEWQRFREDQAAAVGRDPAKRSWDDYSKFDPGRAVYDVKRFLSPQDWIADAAGIKNPEDGIAASMFDPTKQHNQDNNYSNMLDFGAILPPGYNSPDMQKRIYESMTQAEIEEIGKMSRQDQQSWMLARLGKLGYGRG